MSDKLAPLIERQGPWLLQVWSSKEDPDCWAAYVKLDDKTRAYLHKIRRTVEQLKADHPDGFRAITYWIVSDVRFLEEGVYRTELEEFTEELTNGNEEQLLIPDHFIEKFEALKDLRTSGETIHCNMDGVYWSACDKYSNTVYNTNVLAWEDI